MHAPTAYRALAVAPLLALAACSFFAPKEPKPPGPIRIEVKASTRLNPDELGNSLPTAVRLYQLKSVARTGSAELGPLLRDPKEVLGEDFLSVEEVFVEPGGTAVKTISREKDTRAVLVVGVFRRPTGDAWRVVKELPSPRSVELSYQLDEYRIVPR